MVEWGRMCGEPGSLHRCGKALKHSLALPLAVLFPDLGLPDDGLGDVVEVVPVLAVLGRVQNLAANRVWCVAR